MPSLSRKPLPFGLLLFACGATATEVAHINSTKSATNTTTTTTITQLSAKASLNLNYHQDETTGSRVIEGLLPLRQRQQQLIFMQGAWYRQRQHDQLTIGLGHRWGQGRWGWGYHLFYDKALRQPEQRVSVGAEMWLPSLSLSANGYLPLSDWKTVPLVTETATTYRSRPARGFDLTLKGSLPVCPYLEGLVRYAQFFGGTAPGDSQSQRQSHPKSWAFGVSYTPIPLLTLEYRHQAGQGSQHRHRIGLIFTYRFNTPLALQCTPLHVALLSAPHYRRLDQRVNREHTMILEYAKVVVPVQQPQPEMSQRSEPKSQMQSQQAQALTAQPAAPLQQQEQQEQQMQAAQKPLVATQPENSSVPPSSATTAEKIKEVSKPNSLQNSEYYFPNNIPRTTYFLDNEAEVHAGNGHNYNYRKNDYSQKYRSQLRSSSSTDKRKYSSSSSLINDQLERSSELDRHSIKRKPIQSRQKTNVSGFKIPGRNQAGVGPAATRNDSLIW